MTYDPRSLLQLVSPFRSLDAYKKLSNLAAAPFYLSDQMNAERIEKYCAKACGYKLLFGTELITDEILDGLFELASETDALEKMKKMQKGEVMNFVEQYPCENRPVLHTALRD